MDKLIERKNATREGRGRENSYTRRLGPGCSREKLINLGVNESRFVQNALRDSGTRVYNL